MKRRFFFVVLVAAFVTSVMSCSDADSATVVSVSEYAADTRPVALFTTDGRALRIDLPVDVHHAGSEVPVNPPRNGNVLAAYETPAGAVVQLFEAPVRDAERALRITKRRLRLGRQTFVAESGAEQPIYVACSSRTASPSIYAYTVLSLPGPRDSVIVAAVTASDTDEGIAEAVAILSSLTTV